jgi:transcriptional regulator with XRE-family HTH domain
MITTEVLGVEISTKNDRATENIINVVFGRKLRDLRRQRNLTQSELAKIVGFSRVTIANLESGKQNIQLHQIFTFARALNAAVELLVPSRIEVESADSYLGRVRSDLLGASDLLFLKMAKVRLSAIAEGTNEDEAGD